MYRAMAYYFLTHQIDAGDEAALRAACDEIRIELDYENGVQKVILNGRDISRRESGRKRWGIWRPPPAVIRLYGKSC